MGARACREAEISRCAEEQSESRGRQRTLRLEVAVDEAHQVQVLERGDDFGRVELGVLFGQALARSRLERTEKFATEAVFHAFLRRAR